MRSIYQNMLSIVGVPSFFVELPNRRELLQDEQIDGFSIPFNMQCDWNTLFRVFGLWNNSNGICVDGVNVRAVHGSIFQFTVPKPVLVGDFLISPTGVRRQVALASNSFDVRKGLWYTFVQYGQPSPPLVVEKQTFAYIQSLHQTIEANQQDVLDLLNDFFTTIVPSLTAGGYPILNTPAQASFTALVQKYQQRMQDNMLKLEERQWHF